MRVGFVMMETVTGGAGNNQLLYFTSSSVTDDALVYMSDATGHPNLFCRDLRMGAVRQLTKNADGYMKSYVYFDGTPYTGFAKASPALDVRNRLVYYIQGLEVRCVDFAGNERVVTRLPAGQMTGFTHVSADGTLLCVPTFDEAAFDGFVPGKSVAESIDDRVRVEGLSSCLRVFDTKTGEEVLCERVPLCWITHVQFSPVDNTKILYNHEWPRDCGIRRMWLFDGQKHIRLRTEGDGRKREDWTCHEMWQADGAYIIYHGGYADGTAYIGRVRADGTGNIEIALPPHFQSYGHFTSGNCHSDWLVCDGYYQEGTDVDPEVKSEWISAQVVDWDKRTIMWVPLARHGSSWGSQDAHPHPIFGRGDSKIYFTTDISGKREVCAVDTAAVGI